MPGSGNKTEVKSQVRVKDDRPKMQVQGPSPGWLLVSRPLWGSTGQWQCFWCTSDSGWATLTVAKLLGERVTSLGMKLSQRKQLRKVQILERSGRINGHSGAKALWKLWNEGYETLTCSLCWYTDRQRTPNQCVHPLPPAFPLSLWDGRCWAGQKWGGHQAMLSRPLSLLLVTCCPLFCTAWLLLETHPLLRSSLGGSTQYSADFCDWGRVWDPSPRRLTHSVGISQGWKAVVPIHFCGGSKTKFSSWLWGLTWSGLCLPFDFSYHALSSSCNSCHTGLTEDLKDALCAPPVPPFCNSETVHVFK